MGEIENIMKEVSSRYKKDGKPNSEHELIYDSTSETLEPLYFWILDFMNNMFRSVSKISDNFASSPGSGHFSELQGKSSQMQQEASRILATVNQVLKGVINIIYDLKEFRTRLDQYEAADSKDKNISEAGLLSLKQVWMDKVDAQRGIGSINALSSGELNFVTLRDSFLLVRKLEDVDRLDLNERVKRILKPRVQEFFEWKKRSEQELRKRYEIEKTYLKSQVEALRLNSRWAKPYLRAAQQLMQNEKMINNPALVTIFNTLMLELTLMGVNPVDVQGAVWDKELPKGFESIKNIKKYNSVVFVDFSFRGIPSKVGQHYTFGGRAVVKFKSYCLTEDELKLLKLKLEESDMDTALKLVQGMTDDSLGQIKVDIKELLEEDLFKEKSKKSSDDDINPFTVFIDAFKKKDEKKEKSKEESIDELKKKVSKNESYAEKFIRNYGIASAINSCFAIYDVYKKSHGMAAFPYGGGGGEVKAPQSNIEKFMGFK